MEQIARIFIDTSKSVFQLHGVDVAERPVLRRKLRPGASLRYGRGDGEKMEPGNPTSEPSLPSESWPSLVSASG